MIQTDYYLPSKEAVDAQLTRMNKGGIGRSKNHSKLLAYLVDREFSLQVNQESYQKAPKEIEIAIEVFGKTADFNAGDDSTVRVNISNLRKKLENYYANDGRNEAFFISIPVGGYRLAFTENKILIPEEKTNSDVLNLANQKQSKKLKMIIALLVSLFFVSLVVNIVLVLPIEPIFMNPNKVEQAEIREKNDDIWSDLINSKKPSMIVLGDVHNFIEMDDSKRKQRTVIDPNIHNDDDLMAFLKEHPGQSSLTQRSQQIMITRGTSIALRNVVRLLGDNKGMNLRFASEIDAYQLRKYNIIYIGPLNRMGILEQYFKGSTFSLNHHKNSLLDKHSNKAYTAANDRLSGYIDYGLFAKVDGVQGNKIYIMSGFNDPSMMKVSWYLTNKSNFDSDEFKHFFQENRLTPLGNFEMLFKVPSMDGVDMKYEIIYGGKVDSNAVWKAQ